MRAPDKIPSVAPNTGSGANAFSVGTPGASVLAAGRDLRRFLKTRRWRWSALLACLLPGAAITTETNAAPYLKVTGVVALRFQKPVIFRAAPPKPVIEKPPEETKLGPDIIPPDHPVAPETAQREVENSPLNQPVGVSQPKPILPDEFIPRLVPEDVLPYFQFPQASPEKSLSTATYKKS